MSWNELEMIRRCMAGERECFTEIVKHYQANLIAFCWNMLLDFDEACDAAQEAFIQAFLHLNRFDSERKFKTWLFGIAVKRCLDRLRKRRSFLSFFNKAIDEFCPFINPTQAKVENSPIFSPLLKKLRKRERITILLRVNEEYSFKEIGEILHCSEETARVYFFQGKRKLHIELVQSRSFQKSGRRS